MRTSSATKRGLAPTGWSGFTLVELLTVIAIIAILAGLLFPTIKTAMVKAEVAKAQTAIAGLSTAFRAYYTEYGRWPAIESAPATPTIYVSSKLVGILKGEDISGPIAGGVDANTLQVTYSGNPHHIVFLEFKAADFVIPSANVTNFTDPWKQIYQCRFDSDYDNQIADPFLAFSACPGANCINAGFLIWSDGPDGQENPTVGDAVGVNKDNVKSW